MKKALLFIVALLSVAYVNGQELSLKDLLKKHFEAVGQEKRNDVKTIKSDGKQMFQGMEFSFTTYQKRPSKSRIEVDIQGSKMVQAYNGTTGYMINPMMGSNEPQDMPAQQLNQMKDLANLDGKLHDFKKNGSSLELIGKENMDSIEVYNLKLTEKPEKEGEEGKVSHYYIDAKNFMILKNTYQAVQQGMNMDMEILFSNYKQVDGIIFSYSMEVKANGNSMAQLTYSEIKLNEEMADDLFEKPTSEDK